MAKTVPISTEVADILRAGVWMGLNYTLPGERLPPATYSAVNKVLVALGGKWNRSAQAHAFTTDAKDAMQAALSAGHVVDRQRTLEQFFTPTDLAARMVEAIGLREGMRVLEPSAGNGRLIDAIIGAGVRPCDIYAAEIDPGLRAGLISKFYAAFGAGGLAVDFMTMRGAPVFDAAVMNPPFSRNQDIAHVLHALSLLKPGGRLAAIMSAHFTFANDKPSVEFRALVASLGGTVETLPENTFAQEGTNVSAVLVILHKKGEI